MKRPPAPTAVHVFMQHLRDDTTKSDVTIRGWVLVHADGTMVPNWDIHHGPGLGPHEFVDLKLGRRVSWALHHCIDALRSYTGTTIDDIDDPQLSLADAPLAAGHHATIKVGVS